MPATNAGDVRVLDDLITSTLALLGQFTAALSSNNTSNDVETTIENAPNPLRVLGDSAKLVKAHTTKLSLLAINKPFTPSAITKVLKELAATCLPAMMSAVQICEQEKFAWGETMGKEVRSRVRRVFKEMEMLLKEVRSIAAGNAAGARRDSLSSTGVVWESCDALIELEKLGIAGLALQKAQQYRETIKDAIREIKDWAEGDDLDTEGRVDGLLDSDDEGVAGDKDSIDDIFNAANSMPADRPELKALAEEADRTLKKVVLLYSALEKRRISTFDSAAKQDETRDSAVQKLDKLMLGLRRMPHLVDEMAILLYDLDHQAAGDMLKQIVSDAHTASELMEDDWDGREDDFTAWIGKWKSAMDSNR